MNTTQFRYKGTTINNGDQVMVTEPIENGLIQLKPFDKGRIIYHQNQVRATIWFRDFARYYSDPITQALQVDTSYGKNGSVDGLPIELNKQSFAIFYDYKEHDDITINDEKASLIPFFGKDKLEAIETNSKRNIGNGVYKSVSVYLLRDMLTVIDERFEEWVRKNSKFRKIRKQEKENGDFPEDWDRVLNDESSTIFYEKKHELELAFAKNTGVYYEFRGGLLFND